MSNIVRPDNLDWRFQLEDDGAFEDLLVSGGRRADVARMVRDAAGNWVGLAGAGGETIGLRQANKTLYLDGDSLLARTTREDTLTTFSIASNVITFTSPSPTYFAHGAECRMYGFANENLNFNGTIINDSTSVRMAIPTTVSDGDQSTYPAKSGAARAIAVRTTMMDCSPLTQAMLAAGKRWNFQKLAMGGRTSAVIAADFEDQIAGLAPGVFLIESGVNTAKNGESNADVATRYEAMVVAAKAAGHEVILTTPTTFSSSVSSYATYNAQLMRQAQSMREIAQAHNVELWDLQALWVSGVSTDGQPTSGYADASDGIHWNVAFARAAATSLNTLLNKYNVGYVAAPLLRSILDAAYTQAGGTQDASNTNKLRNGQLFGTTGTGTNIADGWTLALTGATSSNSKAASALDAADGTQVFTIAGSSGQSGLFTSTSFHGDLSAGKTVRASGKIRINVSALTRVSVGLLMTIGGRSSQQVVAMSSYTSTLANPSGDVTLDWVTPDYVVQDGAVPTNCQVFMQFVLTDTVTNQVLELSQCRGDVFDA